MVKTQKAIYLGPWARAILSVILNQLFSDFGLSFGFAFDRRNIPEILDFFFAKGGTFSQKSTEVRFSYHNARPQEEHVG